MKYHLKRKLTKQKKHKIVLYLTTRNYENKMFRGIATTLIKIYK